MIIINDNLMAKNIYKHPYATDVLLTTSYPDSSFNFSNGNVWHERRKFVHRNVFSQFTTQYLANGINDFLCKGIYKKINDKIDNNETISFKSLLKPLMFNGVFFMMFGVTFDSINNPFWLNIESKTSTYVKNFLGGYFAKKIFNLDKNIWLKWMFNGNALDKMENEFFNYFIDETKDMQKKAENNENSFYYKALNNKKLYDKKIKIFRDISGIMIAAIDTTTESILIVLTCLAHNKYNHYQDIIYNELKSIFLTDNNAGNIDSIHKSFTAENILELKYLPAFIFEVLRIYPTAVQTNPRIALNDIIIDGKKVIPKGCIFDLNTIVLNKNPKYWSNPNEININNWFDNNGKFKFNDNLTTFSYGKRGCLGKELAKKEIIIILALLLLKYKIIPNHNETIKMKIESFGVMVNNIPLKLDKRIYP